MICLEPLETNLALLSCNHIYHFECISQWTNRKTNKNLRKICTICEFDNEIVNVFENIDELNKYVNPKSVNNISNINNINNLNNTNDKSNNLKSYPKTYNVNDQKQQTKGCVIM